MLKTLLLQPGVKSSFARKATLSHGYWYFNLSHGSGGVRPLPLSFLTQAPLSVPSPSTTKSRYDSSWRGREIWGVGWVWLGRKNNLENNIVKCQTKEQGYIYIHITYLIYTYMIPPPDNPQPQSTEIPRIFSHCQWAARWRTWNPSTNWWRSAGESCGWEEWGFFWISIPWRIQLMGFPSMLGIIGMFYMGYIGIY